MSMHSMLFLMIALLVAIAVLAGLYVAFRVIGARETASDHPRR